MPLDFNGERFVPGMPIAIELEHRHRYALALSLARGKRVLDVASGEGYGAALLAEVADSVVGVDISTEAIEHAQSTYWLPNLEFLLGDCAQLPVESASMDLVVSFETIEHHDQHEAMLAEIERVLRPDGVLIISSPNKKSYSDTPGTHNRFHVKELYLDEFEALLRETFSHVVLYCQRAGMASVITSLQIEQEPFLWMNSAGDQLVSANAADSAIYYLAVASKVPQTPQLPNSAFQIDRTGAMFSETAPMMFETKIFWRASLSDRNDGYSEAQANSQRYAVDGQRHQIKLTFPTDSGLVQRIRLDIMDALGVVDMHTLELQDASGTLIWQWSGDLALMLPRVQVVLLPSDTEGVLATVVSLGNDPQLELNLPEDVCACIRPGCSLVIELTPFRLTDRLPTVLQPITQRVTASSQGTATALPLPSGASAEYLRLARSLGGVKSLVQTTLAQRDQTISEQAVQVSRMREELIRAEAQLDLLKDVMLGSREGNTPGIEGVQK